jgi:hypothetical protein
MLTASISDVDLSPHRCRSSAIELEFTSWNISMGENSTAAAT